MLGKNVNIKTDKRIKKTTTGKSNVSIMKYWGRG